MIKILHHPSSVKNLTAYGIDIPLRDDRSQQVFDYANAHFPLALLPPLGEVAPLSAQDLSLAHSASYIHQLFHDPQQAVSDCYELSKRGGMPQGFAALIAQTLISAHVTYLTMDRCLHEGHLFYLGGGMHHAMANGGRGFCLVNDIVIGIRKLQREQKIKTAWVIDVDAHKGDGTAALTWEDDSIHTLSIHMARGWPLDNPNLQDPCYIPSDLDIPIESHQTDKYVWLLKQGLEQMAQRFPSPDLVVVVDGADPYEYDELESTHLLKLTKSQLLERDLLLAEFFHPWPTTFLMAGGYGAQAWSIYGQFLAACNGKNGVTDFQ